MKSLPEVRIYFSDLLFFTESPSLAGNDKLESYEQYEQWAEMYRKAWSEHGTKILQALTDTLGVSFYKPVLDVACAPFFVPKSAPIIMNFHNRPNQFVDVLMHELCHVLLTDNNKVQIYGCRPSLNLIEEWGKLFGEHDFGTLVHIPVHALSKYIYLDVLKEPERLERDKESVKTFMNSEAYVKAWNYVENHDYREIIDDLEAVYTKVES